MSDTIISVNDLRKKYLIRHQVKESYTNLKDVVIEKVVSAGRRLCDPLNKKDSGLRCEEFWALNGVSFKVVKGEVIGIIGNNGAGKSTLLKILSRITEPTAGRISITGRVASLLEVGTGFHPELTGRENIYLNGAILGMSKAEIRRKFNEIVSFSEVEKFLDTPVKRYSSGMRVRLAFSVAAHLEPEILLIDEVLAVGDSAFQKKCIGKMQDVSQQGRTVLFVSHNMSAITSLCESVIWLDQGAVHKKGDPQSIVNSYLSKGSISEASIIFADDLDKEGQIKKIELVDSDDNLSTIFNIKSTINLQVKYRLRSSSYNHRIGVIVSSYDGTVVFVTNSNDWEGHSGKTEPGEYIAALQIPECFLKEGSYYLTVYLGEPGIKTHDIHREIMKFEISGNPFRFFDRRQGVLVYPFHWETKPVFD